jgi:multiple antibiotic resistance protein
MLAGPGATSTVVVLVSRAEGALHHVIVLLAIVGTLLFTYWVLRGASKIARRLGHTGMNVLERVMGLIVAAVAVQFVVDGIGLVWPKFGS